MPPYPSEPDFYASGDPDVGDARPLSDIDGTGRALPSLLGEMCDQLDEIHAELAIVIDETATAAAQAVVNVHVADTVDAHDASAISFVPTGTVAATTVQAAIVEVNTEKSATTHTHTLDDLTDVATPAPTDGQVLKWSSSSARWAPSTDLVGGGGGGAVTMGDLTDVDLTGLVSGNGITYNGTDFVPTDLATQAELNTDATNLANHLADTVDAHDASAISFVPAGTIAATTVQAAIEEVASEAGGGGGGPTTEEVQDIVGAMVVSGNNITATYSDAANTVVVSVNPLDHNDITDWDSTVREVVGGTGITTSSTATETTINALQPIVTDYTPGSYTWSKGAETKLVEVICVGAGGGGGSGARGAAGAVRGGGGGGASGNHARFLFSATECGTNEAVTVGSGGAGGPAVTTDTTSGNAGSAGGVTSFGALLAASGGGGGGGGLQGVSGDGGTAGALGTRGTNAGFTGAIGAGAGAASIVANFLLNNASNGFVSGSGGGGGSINAANAVQGSSNGGAGPFHRTSATTGGTGGGTGVAGGAGSAAGTYGGSGGGGGGPGTASASGAGGAGARGSGGGGSGGSLNGFSTAVGGAGGAGFCRVIEYR